MSASPDGRLKVALVQFPGSNCEWETKRAAEAAGLVCDVFRWNRPAEELRQYAAYIIGGGFSYQDRVRSGAIATKEPIVRTVFAEVTERGKPCLGICNGAQVLVEAGLIPGIRPGEVQMALAPNRPDPTRRIAHFCCKWVFLKCAAPQGRSLFASEMAPGFVFPIPIAHGEGRFTTREEDLLGRLTANEQIIFQYCDEAGRVDPDRTINPNAALLNIAGLCNPEGTVLALMPHPERASFLRQIPFEVGGEFARAREAAHGDARALLAPGPGLRIFAALKKHLSSTG